MSAIQTRSSNQPSCNISQLLYINVQSKMEFYGIQQINSPMHLFTLMKCPQFVYYLFLNFAKVTHICLYTFCMKQSNICFALSKNQSYIYVFTFCTLHSNICIYSLHNNFNNYYRVLHKQVINQYLFNNFVKKMASVYNVCCINSHALQTY